MISRKTLHFNAGDTLLYEVKKQQHNQSQLKDFIHFIKYTGRRGPIKFKHIEEEAELMANLTLRENLLLEFGIKENTKSSVSELLTKNNRSALSKLVESIKDENLYPKEASTEDKKIISIVKVLFHSSDYLFLEKPEKYLSAEKRIIFFEALLASTKKFNQTIIVVTDHRNLWLNYVNKIISKSSNGHFTLDNVLRHVQTSSRVQSDIQNTDYNSKKAA